MCNFINSITCKDAVSYTHLDVYKRQGIERVSDNKYLPCKIVSAANDDKICLLYTSMVHY